MGLDICHVKPSAKTTETIEYFTLDELTQNPDFLENHRHLITIIDDGDGEQIPCIYYADKGYQRKRMAAHFFDVFENNKLYFDLDTVIKAKQFIEANADENQEEIEQAFQTGFIDNFIEGESVFFISW